jgi:hypothetical protein
MIYDSTKVLLRAILRSLEAEDLGGWDDHVETSRQCLYEMHQMSRPMYKGYKSDGPGKTPALVPVADKVNRAIPHVKVMVSAIRKKDREKALQSGRAAIAEM